MIYDYKIVLIEYLLLDNCQLYYKYNDKEKDWCYSKYR